MKKLLGLIALAATLFASLATFVPDNADAAPRSDRTIEVTWCWGSTEVSPQCPVQEIIRHSDGTLTTVWGGQTEAGQWTYHRPSKTMTMTFDNYPGLTYEGQKQGGCFTGTMTNTTVAQSGVWSGCFTS